VQQVGGRPGLPAPLELDRQVQQDPQEEGLPDPRALRVERAPQVQPAPLGLDQRVPPDLPAADLLDLQALQARLAQRVLRVPAEPVSQLLRLKVLAPRSR